MTNQGAKNVGGIWHGRYVKYNIL